MHCLIFGDDKARYHIAEDSCDEDDEVADADRQDDWQRVPEADRVLDSGVEYVGRLREVLEWLGREEDQHTRADVLEALVGVGFETIHQNDAGAVVVGVGSRETVEAAQIIHRRESVTRVSLSLMAHINDSNEASQSVSMAFCNVSSWKL